jgi:hypothetical protein
MEDTNRYLTCMRSREPCQGGLGLARTAQPEYFEEQHKLRRVAHLGAWTQHHADLAWCLFVCTGSDARGGRAGDKRLEDAIVHPPEDPAVEPVQHVGVEGEPSAEAGRTRRRAPGADPEVKSFGAERTCAAEGCQTRLSRYNPDSYCSVHRGWDRQVVTRRRRGGDDDGDQLSERDAPE